MLLDYLAKDRIKLKIKATDWREVVKNVGNIMANVGDIELRYIDAMIKGIEKYGAYSVVAPGIVLLHAKPKDGAKRTGCVVTTLDHGVNFDSEFDPVYIAIGLAASDDKNHIQLMRDISIFLQDDDIVDRLLGLKSGEIKKAFDIIQENQKMKNIEI